MSLAATDSQTELDQVESWRLHVLLTKAHYPVALAEKLAKSDADLHQAVELIGRGCAHETAFEILI